MLSRIFKGKSPLSEPDPSVRRHAVEALSPTRAEPLQSELLALATSDDDHGVRKACIGKLTGTDAVAGLLDDPVSADAAARRVVELIGTDTDNPLARHPLVLKLRLPEMTPAQAEPELADIDDSGLLIELGIRARADLRAVILQRLQTTAALTELEHRTRGRDKSLNRHAREGLERIRNTRREAQELRARLVGLAEALERNQRVDVDPSAEQRRSGLLAEFEQASTRFEDLAAQLRAVGEDPEAVDEARQQVEAVREQAPEEALLEAQVIEDPFPDLVAAFEALRHAMEAGADFAAISIQRQTLTDQWLRAADHSQPSAGDHGVFESVSHAFRELADSVACITTAQWSGSELAPLPDPFPRDHKQLKSLWRQVGERRRALRDGERLVDRVAWPEWVKPSPEYADLLLGINRIEQELARAQAHEQSLKASLEELVGKLTGEIEAGTLKTAFSTLNEARQESKSLPENYVADLVKDLNREAARLAELRDWQTFATTPKREGLCEAMQALADNPIDPADQADRIKRLRSEWNELGPVSRSEDRRLADRFNALAEKAFEPCRAFFGEQAALRKSNLAERRKICDQLATYLGTDWARADKKAAEQILRTARDEWRRYHPVDRKSGQSLEENFEKLQGRLHELLKAEWESNLKLKQDIVDEASSLLASDADFGDRVNGAKALQRRWREVGVTPRRPDQTLWREFRATCDAIFAARDEARQKSDRASQDAVEAANALVDEFEEVVGASNPADAAEGTLRGFRSRFAELPLLPERTQQGLQRRFDELARSYRNLLQNKARDAERSRLQQLKLWDEAVGAREAAERAGQDSDGSLPDPVFDPRAQTINDELPLERLRALAIRAELLAGMESPASEGDLRMQIQVDRLNAGMSQQQTDPEPLELAGDWCGIGPKHEGCADLRERFFAALARAMED
jgi:exonuclease SbcC